MKKNILLLTRVPLDRDPRVLRQIQFLKTQYNLYLVGHDDAYQDVADCVNVSLFQEPTFHLGYPAILRKFFSFWVVLEKKIKLINSLKKIFWKSNTHEFHYWIEQKGKKIKKAVLKKWADISFSLIIANDIETLPIALEIKKSFNCELLFDAHEYYAHENQQQEEYQQHLCNTYLPEVKNCMTVCEGLAKEYHKNYQIPKPFVITNAPNYNAVLKPTQPTDNIKLIHHGIYSPERLFPLVDMMQYLEDRFTLYFMIRWARNQQNHQELTKGLTKHQNIVVLPPVETFQIGTTINKFDIGMYLFQDSDTNYNAKYSLPNKFFEFVQGRLMVATGPSVEIANYAKKHDLGIVSENFEPKTMAEALNKISTEQIMYHKQKSHEAAHELSGEKNKELLISKVNELVK